MSPKFNIDEVVIRQAVNYPEGNGEYTVTSIITKQEYDSLYPTPFGWTHTDGDIYYGLEGFSVKAGIDPTKILCYHTAEGNLRKKHQGSDFSFTELVNHLQTKIVEKI